MNPKWNEEHLGYLKPIGNYMVGLIGHEIKDIVHNEYYPIKVEGGGTFKVRFGSYVILDYTGGVDCFASTLFYNLQYSLRPHGADVGHIVHVDVKQRKAIMMYMFGVDELRLYTCGVIPVQIEAEYKEEME